MCHRDHTYTTPTSISIVQHATIMENCSSAITKPMLCRCHQPEPDPGELSFQLRHTRRCLRQLCSLGRCLETHCLRLLLRLCSLPLQSVRLRLRLLALCAEPGGLLEVLACRGRLFCGFQLWYRLCCLCCLHSQSLRMRVEAGCSALQRIGFVCQPLNAPVAWTGSQQQAHYFKLQRNGRIGHCKGQGSACTGRTALPLT